MQVNFDQDITRTEADSRKKKRFRVTISASFIVDDDDFLNTDYWGVPSDEVPELDDGTDDEDAMEEAGIHYDEDVEGYFKERDIEAEPVTAQELAEHLAQEHESSFQFVVSTDREDQFTTNIVEIDDNGKAIVPPQTRNQSESTR